MQQPRLNLIVLRSPDIDRAVTFYQALGLEFVKHAHGQGAAHYSSNIADLVFEIYPLAAEQAPTCSTRIGLQVDDVHQTVETVRQLGATVVVEPKPSPWGRRAVVEDFDQHRIELIEIPVSGN